MTPRLVLDIQIVCAEWMQPQMVIKSGTGKWGGWSSRLAGKLSHIMTNLKEIKHGTNSGYSHYKCRCDECKAANAAKAREWRKNNPGYATIAKDRWRENNPGRQYEYHLLAKYSITLEQFDSMIIEQEGRCYICELPTSKLFVDHNHDTGEVRKLLCNKCNTQLHGIENSKFLEKALAYLEENDTSREITTYY